MEERPSVVICNRKQH